ncbi:MAG TPA: hypothetical protein VLC07_03920, partial [Solirubrobacterales bacterium]|nr:hypothetical protein [Solirubrobacterales bacterium]
MQDVGTLGEWGAFFAVVLALLALDLGVLHRRERRIGFREALLGSVVWTLVGLAFNAWLWLAHG